ncbi:MAG: FAD-dependent monooxygenase, partial [Steroidobacteraceae bacterium]
MSHDDPAAAPQQEQAAQPERSACCVVGAGPSGAILALLLARQGVPVTLLESHMDFEREFRGDSLHPSVLEILDEIGLAQPLLQLPHNKMRKLEAQTASGTVTFANYDWIKCKFPFEMVIPQSRFLEFVTQEAKRYPAFRLLMGAQVDELITEKGVVRGVRYQGQAGHGAIEAPLTVAADGRYSRLRRLAGVEPITISPELDILWFRLSRQPSDPDEAFGQFSGQRILFVVNRTDHWQVGYVIAKGGYQQLRA